ncbi:MAG: putative toxin-antitoxin system toxin component, PIN family [Verrucomicrobiota bacterium]
MRPVWVLDTNVVVSAALTAGGTCDRVLRAAIDGRIVLGWSAPMLAEYREVLLRPKFKFRPATVAALLSAFDAAHQVPVGTAPALPDPDDEVFLAAALGTPDRVLVTGNAAHFPAKLCRPAKILPPAAALKTLG